MYVFFLIIFIPFILGYYNILDITPDVSQNGKKPIIVYITETSDEKLLQRLVC